MYHYLPVDVPAGASGLDVTLTYDTSAGVIDLGCFGPDGFRGWSGGARDRYRITPAAATPGYLPGEIAAGTWQVALGLHRVASDGLDYEVRVRTDDVVVTAPSDPRPTPSRPPRRELPAPSGMRWLAGDLHAHTVHSDGGLSIDELACAAVEQGLDFLAVTDHNTVSHHPHLAQVSARHGIVLVPGQEVTTDTGHANAFGDIGWIDFREHSDRWARDVHDRGGLLSINHPVAGDCAWRRPLTTRPPLAEVWHWSWLERRWGGPLAWWRAWSPTEAGQLATPVGGSDFHAPEQGRPLGVPTTWVLCDDESPGAVIAGLRAGRTAVSAGRQAPVALRVDGDVVVLGAAGTLLVGADGSRIAVSSDRAAFGGRSGPCYVEDHDGGVVALCG